MTLDRFWRLLDTLPRTACATRDWKVDLGREYGVALPLLKSTGKRAKAVSCPQLSGDGCPRRVVETETGGIRGICDSLSSHCDPLDLTRDDVNVLALDKPALTSRIGRALSLSGARKADLQAPAWHVGNRAMANGQHVPVYFAVVDTEDIDKTSIFEPVVGGMQPSLLLVPTNSTLSAEQCGYLSRSSVTVRPVTDLIDVGRDGSFTATLLAERILGELDGKASAKISETPKRAWQLPPGTEWSKVTIRFVAEAAINMKVGKDSRRFEPDQLDMKDGRNGNPSSHWELLKLLARGDGYFDHRSVPGRAKLEKKKQILSTKLKKAFGLDGEPITVEPDGFHCQFVVSAADLDQGKQGQVSRKFGYARK